MRHLPRFGLAGIALLGVGIGVLLAPPPGARRAAAMVQPLGTGPQPAPGPSLPEAGAAGPPFDLDDPARIEEGRQQFRVTCAVAYCHGPEGRIGGGAPSLRGRQVGTPEAIYNVIANGRRRMPPWKGQLPPERIWALVAYVRSLENVKD